MSFKRFLDQASSIEELEAQLRDQESQFEMEILGIGIIQVDDDPTLRNNYVEINSNIGNELPELHVQVVPPDVAADDAKFNSFFDSLSTKNTVVDSAMVLISDAEQQIVLFRNGVSPSVSPIAQPGSASAPNLPDFAADILSAEKGMPWAKSIALPAMDGYAGMMPGKFRLFQNLQGPGGSAMNAVYYECKFDIDNDGSGGNAAHDPFHQSDTSLHDINAVALNANKVAFAVLPLDRSERRAKKPGLPDFGHDLKLNLGDVGIAFWRGKATGEVRSTSFIYGDKGPANQIGEGSVHMADMLGINSSPVSGGIDVSTMRQLKRGIIHIAFPGSGQSFLASGGRLRSKLVPDQIDPRAKLFFNGLLQQPR